MTDQVTGLSDAELDAESVSALPDKEVVSILDLNADLDLAIDAAAPIDLAVAANANVAAPIDAAVGANILSFGSNATALADQGVIINQSIDADAVANATQDSTIEQGAAPDGEAEETATAPASGDSAPASGDSATTTALPDTSLPDSELPETTLPGAELPGAELPDTTLPGAELPDTTLPGAELPDLSDGNLLNVNVDLAADANISAPINGAIAANANVAAPIDAAVAANIASFDSDAIAVAQQDAIINQSIEGSAEANADQTSDIQQP